MLDISMVSCEDINMMSQTIRHEVKAKTVMMSVLCPYCGTCYTFRSQAKRAEFMPDSTTPLHPACRASAANAQRVETADCRP